MKVLDGQRNESTKEKVCKMKKALYGLKQALRVQYSRIDNYLKEKNLNKNNEDHNLYYSIEKKEMIIQILKIFKNIYKVNIK